MNRLLRLGLLAVFISLGACSRCDDKSHPGNMGDVMARQSLAALLPVSTNWSQDGLAAARAYADETGTSAIIVLHAGQVVAEWGSTAREINSHSVRKSLLSALYGIAVDRGVIDINRTLAELGIGDESPGLSALEKSATVRDLLMSRSGIYHDAAYQSAYARSKRPARGSHAPGTFWYYNNWDFNALATIFEKRTGLTVGKAFENWIAGPIGMQDFSAADVDYVYENVSIHPAYPFWISARDLARFGLLFLNNGQWQGEQLISADWIAESVQAYSETDAEVEPLHYGYMWWVRENGAYQARGTGQQILHVDPASQVVIVRRLDTCRHGEVFYPSSENINELIRLIMAAHPDNAN